MAAMGNGGRCCFAKKSWPTASSRKHQPRVLLGVMLLLLAFVRRQSAHSSSHLRLSNPCRVALKEISRKKGRGLVLDPQSPSVRPGTLLYTCDPLVAAQSMEDELDPDKQVPLNLPEGWDAATMRLFANQSFKLEKALEERGHKKGARRPLFLSLRLLARLLIFRSLGVSESARFTSLSGLMSHWESMKDYDRIVFYAQMATLIKETVGDELCPETRECARLISTLQLNALSVLSREDLQPIGMAIYPDLALINHDGRPNCVVTFDGWTASLVCIREIKPGEEILIDYISHAMTRRERVKVLREEFHINETEALHAEREGPDPSPSDVEKLMEAQEKIATTLESMNDAVARAEQYRAQLERQGLPPRISGHDRDVWEIANEAWRYINSSVSLYQLCYHSFHPVISYQHLMLGKLSFHLGRSKACMENLETALHGLAVAFGTHSRHFLVEAAENLLARARREFPLDDVTILDDMPPPPPPPQKNRYRRAPALLQEDGIDVSGEEEEEEEDGDCEEAVKKEARYSKAETHASHPNHQQPCSRNKKVYREGQPPSIEEVCRKLEKIHGFPSTSNADDDDDDDGVDLPQKAASDRADDKTRQQQPHYSRHDLQTDIDAFQEGSPFQSGKIDAYAAASAAAAGMVDSSMKGRKKKKKGKKKGFHPRAGTELGGLIDANYRKWELLDQEADLDTDDMREARERAYPLPPNAAPWPMEKPKKLLLDRVDMESRRDLHHPTPLAKQTTKGEASSVAEADPRPHPDETVQYY